MIQRDGHGNKSNFLRNNFESYGIGDYDVGFLNNCRDESMINSYDLDDDGNYPEGMYA